MPQITLPFDSNQTFVLSFRRQRVQPVEHRDGVRVVLIKDYRCLWHDTIKSCSHYCERRSIGGAVVEIERAFVDRSETESTPLLAFQRQECGRSLPV